MFFFLIGITYASNKKDSLKVDSSKNFTVRKPINKIHEKYKTAEFNYDESTENVELSAWQRFKLWLAQKLKELFDLKTPDESMRAVTLLLKILGFLLIAFVIFKIVSAYVNDDGNWIFGRKSDKINIQATDIENNLHETDFKTLVEEALLKNDYRSAIRYYYLLSLKKLSNKEIIEWDSEKTNYDYFQEIKEEKVKKQFQYISYIYDYAWYGEFNIEKPEFDTSEQAFKKLFGLI